MGVPGLWKVLNPAAETRSMTELAVAEGFVANPQGHRGFRIGVDASIWFFQAEYGCEGENPVLRTLFFRCATLMRTTFLPLFVFDGPKCPDFKRGKKINKTSHKLIPGMKAIIEAFGFEWRMAPAEAEAELAYLNRAGMIDAVLSDDVDNFLFGAATVIRNISNNLSGNRANPILNSQGRDDKNHTRLYRASKIVSHPSISLTRGGLILIGLLSGGDYAQAGLPRCGITTAHALASCGFGDSLYEAATNLPRDALPDFLTLWRQGLREELRTNSRGIIGRKLAKLAKSVPESFPDIDILLSYTSPITSESLGRAAEKNLKLTWGKEPDVGKLAALCEFYFEWGYKQAIIKRFRTVLWHSIVVRILRQAVIIAGSSDHGSSLAIVPSTLCKGKDRAQPPMINTPSKLVAKHFVSMTLNSPATQLHERADLESDEPDEPLVVKIHSSRSHPSTDGLLEYRLEVAPAQLVRSAESGIKGTREPPEKDEWASEEDAGGDDDDSDVRKKINGLKLPPDPTGHLRLWIPACMVELAEPGIVEEYNQRKSKKAANKNDKDRRELGVTKEIKKPSKSMVSRRLTRSIPGRAANVRKTKVQCLQENEESDYDHDTLLSMPLFTQKASLPSEPQSCAESSKAPAEREKHTKSVLNHLWLSDEDEKPEHVKSSRAPSIIEKPDTRGISAPFPISLDKADVSLSSNTRAQQTIS
ncbi:hypothetical protein AX14_002730, partial [Amanita brunnescens Koide BX004]